MDLEIIHFTDEAVLFTDGYVEAWVPLSQCRDEDGAKLDINELEKGHTSTFQVEDFIAKREGLI
jgi:hypothetical protein